MMGGSVKWDVVAVTCSQSTSCDALTRELNARQSKGYIDKDTVLLVINDPVDGIGSGGATLNALLVITERLAAEQGYTVVNSDVLDTTRILILHAGRQYVFNSTGGAFLSIPDRSNQSHSRNELNTVFDHLLQQITQQIAVDCPPGVWVCSTDMVLNIPETFSVDWTKHSQADVVALSIKGHISEATKHGIYITDSQGMVQNILYRSSMESLQQHSSQDGLVNIVVGVVYFNKKATEKLLSFHTISPLNSCTYVGIDSGAKPIRVSLFFDLLRAMCSSKMSTIYSSAATDLMPVEQYKVKWNLLSNILSSLKVKSVGVLGGEFKYLFNSVSSLEKVQSSIQAPSPNQPLILNSVIPKGVVMPACRVTNSRLTDSVIHLSENVYLSGVDFSLYSEFSTSMRLTSGIVYQQIRVRLSETSEPITVPVIFGSDDCFEGSYGDGSSFCNQKWTEFFSRTAITPQDLWSTDLPESSKSLMTARLYPVMSLENRGYPDSLLWMQKDQAVAPTDTSRWRSSWRLSLHDLLSHTDFNAEFAWRRELFSQFVQMKVRQTLLDGSQCNLLSLYKSICSEQPEHCGDILQVLDKVAMECQSPGVAARTLANIADVLGCMAGSKGGVRSGPSANIQWKSPYDLLEAGDIRQGVAALAVVRQKWQSRGDHLIRAARHYEGAAQILIRLAVMSAKKFISVSPGTKLPPVDQWILGECPARADIAGGWSDTPPISYEHGGAVTNVAILVDGKKPIGCKAKRIKQPQIVLVMKSGLECTTITINDLEELRTYNQPQSTGALLKAAFVCAGIVDLNSGDSLPTQLSGRYQSGFELLTWSNLPHGSGLGTSSILAGVVMAVLWTTSGCKYDVPSLIHAVLHVEQMMTTGGGWQDQVGGLLPGFKIGLSKAELPLFVNYELISLSGEMLKSFNERFLLIYTGKTRLARNLLQNVVRNWYARDPEIVRTEDGLVELAVQCSEALRLGDLERVGAIWNEYWILKKHMATGCEPVSVAQMIKALDPHVYSCCMAGAGGGGFLYVLTKQPNQKKLVTDVLRGLSLADDYSIHDAAVCTEGLTIKTSSA